MEKIITDTNIWIEIGNNKKHFPVNESIEPPLPALYELYTSKNIIISEEEFNRANGMDHAVVVQSVRPDGSIDYYDPTTNSTGNQPAGQWSGVYKIER